MKKWFLLLVLACSSPVGEDDGSLEIASEEQDLAIGDTPTGWNWETWEHKACTFSTGEHCMFPGTLINSPEQGFARYYSDDMNWSLPYSKQFAAGQAYHAWGENSKWLFLEVTQGIYEVHSLEIVPDESISGVLDSSKNIKVSQVLHYACVDWIDLIEAPNVDHMNMWQCQRAIAAIDKGSFTGWVDGWAVTDSQRSYALAQLYTHIWGITRGVGATSNVGTAMRDTMVRRAPTTVVQDFQKCASEDITPYAWPGEGRKPGYTSCED